MSPDPIFIDREEVLEIIERDDGPGQQLGRERRPGRRRRLGGS